MTKFHLLFFVTIFLSGTELFSQIFLVNHVAAQSTNNGPIATAAIDTTGANALVACVVASTAGFPPTPITDSKGNEWTQAANWNEDGDVRIQQWYALRPKVGAGHTFSATGGGIWAPAVFVAAFSGVSSLDTSQHSDTGAKGGTSLAASLRTSNDNELLTSCLGLTSAASSSPWINAPFSVTDSLNPKTTGLGGGFAYAIQDHSVSISPTWSWANGSYGAALSGAYHSTANLALLSVTTLSLPEAFEGTPYSFQLQATGGTPPYKWTMLTAIPSGLNIGLTFSAEGLMSGSPLLVFQNAPIEFKVTDSSPTPLTANSSGLTMTVAASALTVGGCPAPIDLTQYRSYSCTLAASGGTAPYAWSIASTGSASLPEGLSLNASTGALTSASIGGQGTYVPTITITDAHGASASATRTFPVAGDSTVDGCSLFPANSVFNLKVTGLPVDTSAFAPIPSAYQSSSIKPFFGASGSAPNGIPFIRVPYNQPEVTVTVTGYTTDSDAGPYGGTCPNSGPACTSQFPYPPNAPIEGGFPTPGVGDSHVSVLQTGGGGQPCRLFESWISQYVGGKWSVNNTAYWDLTSNNLRTASLTSGDAAGLPIKPYTVSYDEAASGAVNHAIRFTMNHMLNYYVWPGRHKAGIGSCSGGGGSTNGEVFQNTPPSTCTWSAPSGEIYRLKASVPTPAICSGHTQANVIITAMRQFGIILADNGQTGGLIGTPDSRWNDSDLACLTALTLSNFEPVNVSTVRVSEDSGATRPYITSRGSLPSGTKNVAYSTTLGAVAGLSSGYEWSLSSGSLPSGLTLGSNGMIKGTPLASGTFSLTVALSDGVNTATPVAVTLEIAP
jgi:hypothetical protein